MSYRTRAILAVSVMLGVEIFFALLGALNAGMNLDDRRWGWAAFNLVLTYFWGSTAVRHMLDINEHGILGRSPWPRDQDDE